MPPVGPSLPPTQAEKRKREVEDGDDRILLHTSQSPKSGSTSPSSSAKKLHTIGPTLPPVRLDERPSQSPERDGESSSSSSDDDDFGPSLPTASSERARISIGGPSTVSANGPQSAAPAKSQRDEWMIVPPTSSDWTSRVDPTKLKNRKFNTGKGSKGPAQTTGKDNNANWTETPDEKKTRLQREMMGIKEISTAKDAPEDDTKARVNSRKLREYNVSRMFQDFFLLQG
jgi:Protein of unknown function (DUF3752)